MSDRLCNFCQWQAMKREKRGYRIARGEERRKAWNPNEPYGKTGTVIVDRKGSFVCWFMELPSSCGC